MKIALILFCAQLLATRPKIVKGGRRADDAGARGGRPRACWSSASATWARRWSPASRSPRCWSAPERRLRDIGLLAAAAAAIVLLAVIIEPYRVARITSFLDPGGDPGGAGFQLIQAKIALGSGRPVRGRAGGEPPEGLLPARGPHRHDRRGHRRGARDGRDRRAWSASTGCSATPASGSPSRLATATASCSRPGSPRWCWSRRWSTCWRCSASRRSPACRCRSSPTATRACW